MTGKPFLQRLDDLAYRTGVPKLAAWPATRRPLRALALASLGLGTIGLAIMLIDTRLFWIGDAVLMVGFVMSVWLPLVGPIKPWLSTDERVDERDSAIRANAYLAALPAILLAAIAGLAGLPALGWIQHRAAPEMVGLGGFAAMYLMILWNAIPTLYASWKAMPVEDD